jgi:succinate-semialdehyde dehydrogenase/glutarate-semialdehyde dehydrogenase
MLLSIDPATEAELARFEPLQPAAIDARLDVAVGAQREWRRRPVEGRAAWLLQLSAALRQGEGRYAELITREMGKPITEALAEVRKCATTCDFYARRAAEFLADQNVPTEARDSRVVFDPLGLVLAVMPWNFPFWQAMRAAIPALVAGNGIVLKHASNVPQCALALESVFAEAGAPTGLFTTLLIGSDTVRTLIEDRRIAAVTFTGSTPVGRALAAQAGQALKKQVLELGGSDPFIVMADADIPAAAAAAAKARFQNTGQSCICAKRFIVVDAIADRFTEALCEAAGAYVPGDPGLPETTLGPMARGDLRDELHTQVQATVAQGARLRLGGKPPSGVGFFYPATVLDGVEPGMTAATQETFGPAAAILRVRDAEAAIAVANGSEFGLGAALWTGDVAAGLAVARRLEAGAVFINGMVASDPRLPFGGVKHSGYGRELGVYGLHEFTNIKAVWTGPASPAKAA